MIESNYLIAIVLLPLAGAIVAGLFGQFIGRAGAHWVTILGVAGSCALSLVVLKALYVDGAPTFNESIYTWMVTDGVRMEVGFLVDRLSALMMVVVTFVSLMVHIYTIGYMHDDPGYQRFFCYISLFTFAMLMLVMANNFLQLFFGWEAVGVVSYLLIGFWFTRESAIFANLKAFLVNRVGDFGFLLGIATLLHFTGSLDYVEVFGQAERLQGETLQIVGQASWSALTVACILLFIGAMGKSAQMPLHVWLPDSMEGPTPISALIHAATMVTAGVFMVARMSPLFEYSEAALSFVLVIGATTALLTGFPGHRSARHQAGRGVLDAVAARLHDRCARRIGLCRGNLPPHDTRLFKALLFLAAGSVIIGLHHEQDMRRMGGLKKYMPITYWTSLIGSLALIGFPGFAGFFSKDALIEAVHLADRPGALWANFCVMVGVFVTALYSFRMFFLVFHGPERIDDDARGHLHESPWVVTVPLIALAVFSLAIGWPTIGPLLFGDFFGDAIFVLPANDVLAELGRDYHGPLGFLLHGLTSPVLYLALGGVVTAWYFYMREPAAAESLRNRLLPVHRLLTEKYYFDALVERVIPRGGAGTGRLLWRFGDAALIDGAMVNGSARLVGWLSGQLRRLQTGYLYHYAFVMVIGLSVLVGWLMWWA